MTPQAEHVADYIMGTTTLWEERMALRHWDITHYFLDTQLIEGEVQDDYLITATTETRWNYLTAKIKWYLPSAVRHSDEVLEATLVHELCHVALAPEQSLLDITLDRMRTGLTGEDMDQVLVMMYERMELATETMSRSILRAYRV